MHAEQLVNRYAGVYIRAANARGYDLQTILNHSGISAARPARSPFTLSELIKLSRNVKVLLRDEFFGLTESGCRLGAYEMMVDLALSTPTLADALHKVFRFYALLSADIRFSLLESGGQAAVQVRVTQPERDQDRFLCEWWLLNLWSLSSWLVGEKIRCRRFEFPHRPDDETGYRLALATDCCFAQPEARLLFSSEYLRRPVVKNTANIAELFLTRDRFGEIPGTTEALAPRLRALLLEHFSHRREFPSLGEAAGQCHLASHTLRRRLVDEGTSFTRIKDEIRRELILKLLRTPNLTLNAVTELGGFADTSSLARAVKNWTGLYPKQYKERIGRTH